MTADQRPHAGCETRTWYLDLLRILASFGVVFLHTSPFDLSACTVSSVQWKTATGLNILFRWCVPVFFMISGALYLSAHHAFSIRKLYRKSILRLAVSFAFWSALYAAAHCIIMGKGKWTFLNQFLRGHYHMWFIFSIFGLYLLTPLIRCITQSKKNTEYALVLGFIYTFLFPLIFSLILLFDFPHADVVRSFQSMVTQTTPLSGVSLLYYYILGHYLNEYVLKKPIRCIVYVSGAAGLVLTMILTFFHSESIGSTSAQYYDPSSATVMLTASAIFLLFRQAFAGVSFCGRPARMLLAISACSYGVYLVHPFVIEHVLPVFAADPAAMLAVKPLASLAVYAAALFIILLIRRIPLIGKLIA